MTPQEKGRLLAVTKDELDSAFKFYEEILFRRRQELMELKKLKAKSKLSAEQLKLIPALEKLIEQGRDTLGDARNVENDILHREVRAKTIDSVKNIKNEYKLLISSLAAGATAIFEPTEANAKNINKVTDLIHHHSLERKSLQWRKLMAGLKILLGVAIWVSTIITAVTIAGCTLGAGAGPAAIVGVIGGLFGGVYVGLGIKKLKDIRSEEKSYAQAREDKVSEIKSTIRHFKNYARISPEERKALEEDKKEHYERKMDAPSRSAR